MRIQLLLTIVLFAPLAVFAQSDSELPRESGVGEDAGSGSEASTHEFYNAYQDAVGSTLFVTDSGELGRVSIFAGAEPPQHRILKGMGLRLRQISDSFIYEHFPLADQTGMVAENVLANLPAHKAGIRWNDVIAKVDGKPFSSVEEFVKAYEECKNDEVSVEIIQKGKAQTVTVSKSDVAKWEKDYKIGVHVHPVPEELALHLGFGPKEKPGLYISDVVKDSPAEKAGLKAGDLLLKADGTTLKSTDVLNNLVRESQGRDMSLEFLRAGKPQKLTLAAAEQPKQPFAVQLKTNDLQTYWAPINVKLGTSGQPQFGTPGLSGFGQPLPGVANAQTLERLTKAVEKLSQDVAELRKQLEKKPK